jgi:SAM-dependent methyltransferase
MTGGTALGQALRRAADGSIRRLPRPVYAVLRRTLPAPVRQSLRRLVFGAERPTPGPATSPYEVTWETAAQLQADQMVGGGDFDLIGRIELGLLLTEGLRPTDTLLDFGCGSGRLAVQVIPVLRGGHYLGVDVSQTMINLARDRVAHLYPNQPCQVSWTQLTEPPFSVADASIDMVCAFSVFTHLEHEDTYRYLKDARRIVRPGGRFIFSCLPMMLADAQGVFLASAARDFHGRWSMTRDVTTSVDLMNAVATLAGWTVVRWYAGDAPTIQLPGTEEFAALGQSTCVLVA